MSKIINLYGGPGTGKSTSAAYLYYQLKNKGVNCELVREYVKNWVWEGRVISPYEQFYFLGKQIRQESLLLSKVDVIVTDSPVFLNIYYAKKSTQPIYDGIRVSALGYYKQLLIDGHEHRHIFLNRTKKYNPAGRYQSEEEAKKIDFELKSLLSSELFPYEERETSEDSLLSILGV